jgi:ATP-dependent DNA helicase RecG
MTRDELLNMLRAGEWNDVEFKEARADVPKSAFDAVSAFANTHGGWIVFGILQSGEDFSVIGVEKPDKVPKRFPFGFAC